MKVLNIKEWLSASDPFNHGKAVAKVDMPLIKKGDIGRITAYLPEKNIFAVYFDEDENKWYTFHNDEKWFKEHFYLVNAT